MFGLILIVLMVAFSVLLSFYVFLSYAHTDEKSFDEIKLIKVISLWGISLSVFTILLPGFDIFASFKMLV